MFHFSVSEEVGLLWGRRTCLYSRHAWRCIIATIVLGLHWSANSLSTEEHKFNWPQLASYCAGGLCLLLWVTKDSTKITCCYIAGRENCSILYVTYSGTVEHSLYIKDFVRQTHWPVLTPTIPRVTSSSDFSTLQLSSEGEAMGRRVSCTVNASIELFSPQGPLCHCECSRLCQLRQVVIGRPCRSCKKLFSELELTGRGVTNVHWSGDNVMWFIRSRTSCWLYTLY